MSNDVMFLSYCIHCCVVPNVLNINTCDYDGPSCVRIFHNVAC